MEKKPSSKLDVKLIALDLDDTLLNNRAEISDKTVETLKKCAEKEIYVVLASGRPEYGIVPLVSRLDIAGNKYGKYLIAINGCSVFDLHKRQKVYERNVPSDVLLCAEEVARNFGLYAEVYTPNTIYYEKETPWTIKDVELCKIYGKEVQDFRNFIEKGSFPKMLIPGEPETLQKIQSALKEKLGDRVSVFTSKPFFLEILPANCGKGQAIRWLSEYAGVPLGKTMAFGDGMNDESMILEAKYGVAMKNANPVLKDEADFVTEKTNDEDGVADFIEKYIL